MYAGSPSADAPPGDYEDAIETELLKWTPCTNSRLNYLYYCNWGEIHLVGDCESGCVDGCMGLSDYCSPNFKRVVSCNLWYPSVKNEWETKGLLGAST